MEKIVWEKIDIKALDDEKIEFFYHNAVQINNDIRKTSDIHRQKSGLYLTGCILLLTVAMPLIISIVPSIYKIIHTIYRENITWFFIFILVLVLPSIVTIAIIMRHFWQASNKFHTTLQNKIYTVPYLPPKTFFKNELYKEDITTIKIHTIILLEDIITENSNTLEKNTKSLDKGLKYFQKALHWLIISPIIFLICITLMLVLLQIYDTQLLNIILYCH